jgi:hypothetical protein
MIDDSESKMLRAFCMLDVDSKGSLDVSKIKGTLHALLTATIIFDAEGLDLNI